MRVLIIHDYGTQSGGAENYTFNLIDALRKKDIEVRLFSSDIAQRDFLILADDVFNGNSGNDGRLKAFIKNIYSRDARRQLKRVLAKFNPDVVHIQMFLQQCTPAILSALKGRPVFVTVHEYGLFCPNNMKFIIKSQKQCSYNPGLRCVKQGCVSIFGLLQYTAKRKLVVKNASLVKHWLPPSTYAAKLLFDSGRRNIKVIPYGFVLQKYNYRPLSDRPDQKQILFLGRLDKSKGGEILVRAFNLLLKSVPDAELLIVGGGSQSVFLKNLVTSLGIVNRVDFKDWVKPEEVHELHYKSSILVAPSIWPDNLPLVICEAMLLGTPVLASRIGGIPDLLDDIPEFLFEPGNVTELAEKMNWILLNRGTTEKLAEKARGKAEVLLASELRIKEIIKLYYQILNSRGNQKA